MKVEKIVLLTIISSLFFGIGIAQADYNSSFSSFSSINDARSIGYQNGFGGGLEFLLRHKYFGFVVYGRLHNEPKMNAANGYTHAMGLDMRVYLQDFYFGVGRKYCGYKSTFSNGETWKKESYQTNMSVGYEGRVIHSNLVYNLKEYNTDNKVESLALTTTIVYQIMKDVEIIIPFKATILMYDQLSERLTGYTKSIGIGLSYSFDF
ncbi:hypothetical protein ACFL27_23575 [candidate division CSSED10-310 bacterium]|uniref:DUF481 domain-containing protein n=1 Tax=candidate division CSSED10-310 bacterium TaxID=2855610 RepID=A0ABV6Z427_UNCC1